MSESNEHSSSTSEGEAGAKRMVVGALDLRQSGKGGVVTKASAGDAGGRRSSS